MRTHSPIAVRAGLIGVFAVLAVGLLVPDVSAQMGPRPPGVPPIPQPNFPQIPRPNFPPIPQPNFPRMPDLPGPGGIGGIGGFEHVYTCGKCGREIGRGTFRPGIMNCGPCGLTYLNGRAEDRSGVPGPGIGGIGGMPRPGKPGMPAAPPLDPAQPVNLPNANVPELQPVFANDDNGNAAPPPPVDLSMPGSAVTPAPATVTPPKSNRALFIIGGVVLGLLVVLGMVVGVMYVKANAKTAEPGRRRRAARDEYDD